MPTAVLVLRVMATVLVVVMVVDPTLSAPTLTDLTLTLTLTPLRLPWRTACGEGEEGA